MIKHRYGGVEYAAEGFIIHDVAGCAEDSDLAVVHGADVVGVGGGEVDVVEDDDDGEAGDEVVFLPQDGDDLG